MPPLPSPLPKKTAPIKTPTKSQLPRTLSRAYSRSASAVATAGAGNPQLLQRSQSTIREYRQRWIGAILLSTCLFLQLFLSVTTTTTPSNNHHASSDEGIVQHLWASSNNAADAARRRRASYSSSGDNSHLTTDDWLALTPIFTPEPPKPGHGPTTTCPVDHCLALGDTPEEQYPNRIVFQYKEGGAGLMDRLIRLRHLMNLGALLCATVEIPPPKALLCRRHNKKNNVPKSLIWHDLAAFEFLQQDESIANATTSIPTKLQQQQQRQLWSPMVLQDGDNKSATMKDFYREQKEQRKFQVENPGKVPPKLTHYFFNNENGTHFLQDMYNVVQRRIAQKQQQKQGEKDGMPTTFTEESFLWRIKPGSFWNFLRYDLQGQLQLMMEREQEQILLTSPSNNKKSPISKLPTKSTFVPQFTQGNLTKRSCGSYVRYRHPPRLLALAKMVLLQAMAGNTGGKKEYVPGIQVQNNTELFPPFGFFHIRRGDATTECDTEFARMKSVVNCSLSGNQTKYYLKAQVDPRNITTDMVPEWMIRDKPLQPRPFIIFFATDDQHTTYRRSIRKLLERQPLLGKKKKRPWIRAVDLDKLIGQVVQHQVDLGYNNELGTPGIIPPKYATNNYVIFAIGKILSSLSLFTLSQRKARFCEDCSQDYVESAFVEYVKQERLEHAQSDEAALLQRQEDKWDNLDFVDK